MLLLLTSLAWSAPCATATYFRDVDRDGYGNFRLASVFCERVSGYPGWARQAGDCVDNDPAINPAAVERCDGRDNDCDRSVDEEGAVDAATWYRDRDGDGYGVTSQAVTTCSRPAGYAAAGGDCDALTASVHPGADEWCNGIDDDCSGEVDEADAVDATPWYPDRDGDGWGAADDPTYACSAPAGYGEDGSDCDDADPAVSPDAIEVCDGLDDDCDGLVDVTATGEAPADAPTWYADADGDTYGDASSPLVACDAPPGYVADATDCVDDNLGIGPTCPPEVTWSISWGDLHAHTDLSHDGCEDEEDWCQPEGSVPGELLFAYAAEQGLSFVAITDHAEYDRYQNASRGIDVDIWAEQQAIVQENEGGPVIPILGYEFTFNQGHRTVVFDADEVCEDYRLGGEPGDGSKVEAGYEVYTPEGDPGFTNTAEWVAAMEAVSSVAGCEGIRWRSWFHHPAMRQPAAVGWAIATNRVESDTVVEIASEHGSSECANLGWDGCDFRVPTDRYRASSSVQTALQLGYRLGFVGGSDNHQAHSVELSDGTGGYVGQFEDTDGDGVLDTVRHHFTNGSVTGVIHEGTLDRSGIFDAIDARHTVAATWTFEGLRLYAFDAAGNVYLPGDDVPADVGPLVLVSELDDPSVESWYAEIVDPSTGDADPSPIFSVDPGTVRYARIRAWVGGVEQRVWASPFFAAE